MSFLLISCFSVLTLGAIIVAVLSWLNLRWAPHVTATILALELVLWLIAGQSLPLGSLTNESHAAFGLWPANWYVDATGWQLSFFFLLMVEAVVAASLAYYERQNWTDGYTVRKRVLFPSILLTSAAALLTIWTVNLAGLLISWLLLPFSWLLLLWAMSAERVTLTRLLPRACALLLGALFLWLAVVNSEVELQGLTLYGTTGDSANLLYLLAAMVPLGALPLQWWRPLAWSLPSESAMLVHLVPVVAGGSLLTRIGDGSLATIGADPLLLVVTTSLGLMGMLVGISLGWMYVASPDRALSGLALAQAGVVVLAAGWVGPHGVLAATRVLLLGIGGLYLAARWAPRKLPWPALVPLLALAGIPLTAGYSGLFQTYAAWLADQQVILLIMGVLLSMFLLAAGILVVRREVAADELVGRDPLVRSRHFLALALPSLGLLMLPGSSISDTGLWSWIGVVMAMVGGLVLSRYEAQIQEVQLALRSALHLGFLGRRLMRMVGRAANGLDVLVREMAAILEGEGGMLWLLVFVIVIWLARR